MKDIHYKLVKLFRKHGAWHRKKHGEWITLNVLGKTLVLDTWNMAIKVFDKAEPSGKDIYGGIVCFHGDSYQIAIDFGGKSYSPMLPFWYTQVALSVQSKV